MTARLINADLAATFTAVLADEIVVMPDVNITAFGGFFNSRLGIHASGTDRSVEVTVHGSIVGADHGIALFGTTNSNTSGDGYNDVVVSSTGLVHGLTDVGIVTWGANSSITNHGTVIGQDKGASLYGHDLTVTNTGTITGQNIGVLLVSRGTPVGPSFITNTGTISTTNGNAIETVLGSAVVINHGQLIGDVQMGGSHDQLLNTGTITGQVRLGTGDDLYDGRGGGIVTGIIDAGIGNDIVFGSDMDDDIFGGDDDDEINGGNGDDTLNGGNGDDTAVYNNSFASYTVASFAGGVTTVSNGVWTDTLTNIEHLRFSDQTVAVVTPNSPPTATLGNLALAPSEWNNIGLSVVDSDLDGDAITQYEVWDSTGGNNFWVQFVGEVDASSGYTITAAQLDGLWVQGDAAGSAQTLWIRANDGTEWGEWDTFVLTTTDSAEALNSAATATQENLSLAAMEWDNIGNTIAYADVDGDTATHFQIWDSEGTDSFWVQYAGMVDASSGYTITAEQLSGLWVQGDAAASDQTLWVRAYDGTEWGAWDSFDLTTL